MQFQPPPFDPRVKSPDIGSGIEQFMNAYMQMKQLGMQQQQASNQQQQFNAQQASLNAGQTAQYGAPLTSFTPQEMQSAGTMAQPGWQNPSAQLPGNAQFPPEHQARLEQLAQGLMQTRQGPLLEQQKMQAEIANQQGQAAEHKAIAGMYGSGSGPFDSFPMPIQTLAQKVVNGDMAPSQANDQLSRSQMRPLLAPAINALNPKFNYQDAEAKFGGKKTLETTQNSSAIVVPTRLLNSTLTNIQALKDMSNKVPRGSWPLINKVGLAAAAATGDPGAATLLAQAKVTADEFQAQIGTGSDAKLALGLDLFDAAKNQEQMNQVLDMVAHNVQTRANAYQGNPQNQQNQVSNGGQSIADQAAAILARRRAKNGKP